MNDLEPKDFDRISVTLFSNAKSTTETENKINCFHNKLARKIELDSESLWEVAIRKIIYPRSWQNVPSAVRVAVLEERQIRESKTSEWQAQRGGRVVGSRRYTRRYIYPGNYTLSQLLGKINEIGTKFADEDQAEHTTPHNVKPSLLIQDGDVVEKLGVVPDLPNSLGLHRYVRRFAFQPESMWQLLQSAEIKDTGAEDSNLSGGIHALLVYSNIVDFSAVGDVNAQLLGVIEIPTDSRYLDDVAITFANPVYYNIKEKEFDKIHIEIRDDSGELINFKTGRTIIQLEIRRQKV